MTDKHAERLKNLIANTTRTDGWENPWTGLGTTRDKMTKATFGRGRQLCDEELDALYGENDMAARICDALPEDAMREGFGIKITTDQDAERDAAARGVEAPKAGTMDVQAAADASAAILDRFEELGLAAKLIEAAVWGRVFGWGAMVLGADDGAQSLAEPLNEDAIRSFTHVNVLDKRFVAPLTWYTDPTAPNHGKPATYLLSPHAVPSGPTSAMSSEGRPLRQFNPGERASAARALGATVEVHESRLLVFEGIRTTVRRRQLRSGFADSVLQRVNTTLTQFGTSWDSLAHILQDAYQGVYKMEGLIDLLAANSQATVSARFAMMDQARSQLRSLVLDAEKEDFTRLNVQWSGLDKVMELFMIRLAAAARMPATILLGQSPAGMDATGESDLTWWYNTVDFWREQELQPRLRRLVTLIASAQDGPTGGRVPDSWEITFPALWTPSDSEAAEIRFKQAQTDKIYEEMGAVTASEIATSRFTADGWSPETSIDLEARREVLDDELDQLGPQDDPMVGPDGKPLAPGGAPEPATATDPED